MSAEDIIREALREYVGDGDGADEAVLEEYNTKVIHDYNQRLLTERFANAERDRQELVDKIVRGEL